MAFLVWSRTADVPLLAVAVVVALAFVIAGAITLGQAMREASETRIVSADDRRNDATGGGR
jgi:hypothetical protein